MLYCEYPARSFENITMAQSKVVVCRTGGLCLNAFPGRYPAISRHGSRPITGRHAEYSCVRSSHNARMQKQNLPQRAPQLQVVKKRSVVRIHGLSWASYLVDQEPFKMSTYGLERYITCDKLEVSPLVCYMVQREDRSCAWQWAKTFLVTRDTDVTSQKAVGEWRRDSRDSLILCVRLPTWCSWLHSHSWTAPFYPALQPTALLRPFLLHLSLQRLPSRMYVLFTSPTHKLSFPYQVKHQWSNYGLHQDLPDGLGFKRCYSYW